MPLVVEDGSVVAGADSFLSLDDARDLASRYNITLPTDDTEAESALRNGALYLLIQEPMMCGTRVSAAQELSYPRQGVCLYGFPVASDSIPGQIKLAQLYAAAEYGKGTDVRASTDGRVTTHEEVVGAVVVEYANNGNTGATITITAAIDALRPLLCGLNNGSSFNVYRG